MKKSYIKKRLKISKNPDKHIPNKRESEAIRKAMSETGKTEQELRGDYYYRKLFSEAGKVKVLDIDQKIDRYYKRIWLSTKLCEGFRVPR